MLSASLAAAAISASIGQKWTASCFYRKIAGAWHVPEKVLVQDYALAKASA